MTTNHDLAATWTYHNGTKHSLQSVRNDPHYLDWENQPLPFKIYSTLEPLPLPHALPPVQMPTLTALSATGVEHAPATGVYTSPSRPNAWKYQARPYRHCFWDAGTLLANLLAATTALEVPAQVVVGFVDSEINRLLDLDTKREVALALVPLGSAAEPVPGPLPTIEPLNLQTVPLSKAEVDYPAIHAMHAASSLQE